MFTSLQVTLDGSWGIVLPYMVLYCEAPPQSYTKASRLSPTPAPYGPSSRSIKSTACTQAPLVCVQSAAKTTTATGSRSIISQLFTTFQWQVNAVTSQRMNGSDNTLGSLSMITTGKRNAVGLSAAITRTCTHSRPKPVVPRSPRLASRSK